MTTWKLVEHAVLMAGIACSACAYAAAPGGAADNPAPTAEANEAGGGGSVALSPPAAETAPEANPEAGPNSTICCRHYPDDGSRRWK